MTPLEWAQAYTVDLAGWAIIVGVAVLVADALGLLGGE